MIKRLKKLMVWMLAAVLGGFLFVVGCYLWVGNSSADRLYTKAAQVPIHDVAMVLGTSPTVGGRWENPYFTHRMDAALELYRSGRVQRLLVSGDNGQKYYNEPVEMLEYLTERGVPREHVYLDYAGFRTLDSVVRTNKVFGQDRFIIISQGWHLQRALFIARKFDLDAIGFAARDYSERKYSKAYWREYLARTKAVLDVYLLNKSPKFLGDPVVIELDR